MTDLATSPDTSATGSAEPCLVCREATKFRTVTWHRNPDRRIYINQCAGCGFIRVVDNPWDYAAKGFSDNSTTGPRVGKVDAFGREYHMATLGLHLLGRSGARVLILGAGLSRDWMHISALDQVASVTTSDLENFNESPDFLELHEQGSREFDVVLACEVLEHLADPQENFAQIFSNLSDDGVFVASTNIYDGSPLDDHWYPFIPGHVSYHTARSITRLALDNGLAVDFRVPLVGMQRAGRRKRYVIFAKRSEALARAASYFAVNRWAPSEEDKRGM